MEKFIVNGQTFHRPTDYDQYATVKPLQNECVINEFIVYTGNELRRVIEKVRVLDASEIPVYMQVPAMVRYDEREEIVVASYVDGVLTVSDDLNIDEYDMHSIEDNIVKFLMNVLFDKNKYLYYMLTTSNAVNGVHISRFANGLLSMLLTPRKMTVIETMAKTIGEKMAINSIQNDITVTNGKKAAILSQDQLHSIKTLKLDNLLVSFQRMVSDGVLSIEQLDKVILGMKYLIKFKLITHSDLEGLISRYEDDIVEKKINLEIVIANTIKSLFNLYDITAERDYRYGYYSSVQTFKSIFSHYMDAIRMLPPDAISNPKYYRTNDVERYHGITTRNSSIYQVPREAEFAAAVERLRKLNWENETYKFSPFKTEDELFFVGQQYNNCLPVYRDKIIDDGAILICAYKKLGNGTEDCPDFVFEVTPYLDVLEISSYNNEEVVDPERIECVRAFRKAKWYLLSKGRTVYREPDENDDET